MNSVKIYSTTKDNKFTLLREGKPAIIGTCDEYGKRYEPDATCVLTKLITFDFEGDGVKDYFFFEDKKIGYYFISIDRPAWINDLLTDCMEMDFINDEKFIDAVVSGYTIRALGFK
ncbi:MAG TPA: hypothetical protein VNZ49_11915 [Bacteroidia bacterium]|jgi:hypothetical protein|nr:hypothetical protein [Bacteroidia bacterium]